MLRSNTAHRGAVRKVVGPSAQKRRKPTDKPQPPDYPARQQHDLEDVLQGEHEQDDSHESDCNGDHDEQTRERSLWHECRASPCGARGVPQHDSELIEDGATSSATESPASLAYSASSPGSNARGAVAR
jgi:hypothetical protein